MKNSDPARPTADVDVREGVLLRDYTTFQLGGPCRRMYFCRMPEQLVATVRALRASGEEYVLIGGGSNLLISDEGIPLSVIRYFSDEPVLDVQDFVVEVSGSTILDHLVRETIRLGLDGLINCSGIPGAVGGAVVGNAGAFGREIAEVIERVDLMAEDGSVRAVRPDELGFSYRQSRLHHSNDVVLSVRLKLVPGDVANMKKERDSILALRREKHPDWPTEPCIGSIFRNVDPARPGERRQAAGWFLEQAGAKGMRVGGAIVFPQHANIIVKQPDGTAQDVFDLARMMADAVYEKFGLRLIREVRFLGPFRGAPADVGHRFF